MNLYESRQLLSSLLELRNVLSSSVSYFFSLWNLLYSAQTVKSPLSNYCTMTRTHEDSDSAGKLNMAKIHYNIV